MSNIKPFKNRDVIRREARDWVLKFNQERQPSAQEIEALQLWVNQSPEHLLQLKEAEANWCDADLLAILKVSVDRKKSARRRTRLASGFVAAACTVVLLIFSPIGVLNHWNSDPSYVETKIGEVRTIALDDGSIVQLDTNSAISVRYTEQQRHIDLVRGKAYFDVETDPQKPFEVYTLFGKVKAVGTAFAVHLSTQDMTVTVEEGRVELSQNLTRESSLSGDSASQRISDSPNPQETFLSLGQGEKAIYAQNTQAKHKLLSGDLARNLAWRRGVLIFAGEPLEQVVGEISRYTSVKIDIVNPKLKTLEVGGRFETGELEALLDVLEVGFGVQVSHVAPKLIELR